MTSIPTDPGARLRTTVTRIHATCLFAIGSQRMAYVVALTVHIPLVLLETFALMWKAPFLRAAR